MTLTRDHLRRLVAVAHASELNFVELVGLAELDPAVSFRGTLLQNVDMRGQDLSGFDFTGTKLPGCDLSDADLSRVQGLTKAAVEHSIVNESTIWPLIWRTSAGNRIRRGDPDTALWHTQNVPQWADTWGRDQYGAWAIFSVPDPDGHPVTQRLRWIAPGSFMIGSPPEEKGKDEEQPHHNVTFAAGFWMFDTACPEKLWTAVMDRPTGSRKSGGFPITNVSWNDAQDFVTTLNTAKPGLDMNLPSEAMWEYCCRAGTTSAYSFGDRITKQQVNFESKGTVVVGSLPPNDWGLYEMHGNVWEWCADSWHDTYNGAPDDGTAWIDEGAASRVVRGGSWNDPARLVRAAFRFDNVPDARYDIDTGFRCARVQTSEAERRAGRSKRQERSDQAATTGPKRERAQPKPL